MSSPARPVRVFSQEEEELAAAIRYELAESHVAYSGAAIPAEGNANTLANAVQRDRINVEGVGAGCHECNSKLATDPDQPWIGDHMPPWNLDPRVRSHFGLAGHDDTWLVPSCQACSAEQSGLVVRMNFLQQLPKPETLTLEEQRMLGIQRTWQQKDAVQATGPKVNDAQGRHVQAAGIAHGCHINPLHRVPQLRYIADHNPPAQFNTPSMQRLCAYLGVDLPADVVLKPHCPRCSSGQGPRIRSVVARAERLMQQLGWSGTRNATPARYREGEAGRDDERQGRSLRMERRAGGVSRSPASRREKERGRSRSPDPRDERDRERDRSPKRHDH